MYFSCHSHQDISILHHFAKFRQNSLRFGRKKNILEPCKLTEIKQNKDKIYDIGHKVLPNLSKYHRIGDIALFVPIIALLFSIPKWSNKNTESYFKILGLMYIFRGLCNSVTTYPSVNKCVFKPPFGFCNDYMFSGHTTFNVVSSYFIGTPLWPIWPIISSLFAVASREHYTVDIFIAWIIFAALKCRI